jgi:hypothetical protein
MASKMRDKKLELAKRQTAIRAPPPPTLHVFLQQQHGNLFTVTAGPRQAEEQC